MKANTTKLDLENYLTHFNTLLSRPKPIEIEGDINIHYHFINELSTYELTPPPEVINLDQPLLSLDKHATLHLDEIIEFTKIFRYFTYLKGQKFEGKVREWLDKIITPDEIIKIEKLFTHKWEIKEGEFEELDTLNKKLNHNKEQISAQLHRMLSTKKLSPYLVDNSIHLIHNQDAILVRGGFNSVINASVVGRSSGGFFYIIPDDVTSLKFKRRELELLKEDLLFTIRQELSTVLHTHLMFLKFINKAFDRFDHYQARVTLAKSNNWEFLLPSKDQVIKLHDFVHPAITHHAKPITINFEKKILLLTGVNAGGKTMMLKSILSSIFLSRHLLPMKINAAKSHIGSFKEIIAILDDPQSVKNDISTFAGRMLEFSEIFGLKNALIGVDEIELGTDSDEAASLFKVLLTHLKKDAKIVITTHHKKLASLMAKDEDVALAAALYDEQHQTPTYEFMMGTIGRSYAFETAERYNIPKHLVSEAKNVYGEDHEKLNDLIQKSASLEIELKQKIKEYDTKIAEVDRIKEELHEKRYHSQQELKKQKRELEIRYTEATNEAKEAIKAEKPQAHRHLNSAHGIVKDITIKEKRKTEPLNVDDRVRYNNSKGKIVSISGKKAQVEMENGMKLRCKLSDLEKIEAIKQPRQQKVNVQKPDRSMMRCELIGMRGDDAMDKLDDFISNSLMVGYDELLIVHGLGSGILSKLTKEFLRNHPKVKSFADAPASMGGSGAKLVQI
jgi:DNA mismatch repair protein MutS2